VRCLRISMRCARRMNSVVHFGAQTCVR
jgi:hypothetical protein